MFSLFLHRLRPEKELAEAARARLAEVPRALRQGMDNLDFAIVPRIYAVQTKVRTRLCDEEGRDRDGLHWRLAALHAASSISQSNGRSESALTDSRR